MKKDWTYKKLGEVLLVERGGSPRPIQEYITTADDGLNWIKIGDAVEGSKYITSTKEKIKPEGLKKTRFVHKGDFILSNSMSFGRPYILGIDGCIHDGWLVLRDNDDTFDKSYLYYYLSNPYLYEEFKRLAVGGVVNNLNSDIVRNVQVAIPPLSIQRSIVAELDLLHSVISKKKEQLCELDNLAQSLFYQMFGDPITNPMGWQVKKLGEVASLLNGRAYQQKELLDQGKYRVLRVGNFFTNNTWYYSDLELPEDKYCDKGDLLFTWSASFGAHIWNGDKVIYHYHIWKIVLDEMYVDKLFYLHLLNNMVKSMMHDTHGTGMLHLTKAGMEMYDLPLPPLSLQQSFAAKVSAIEEQKQSITQSIQHTEALLAQRMDNYFGI